MRKKESTQSWPLGWKLWVSTMGLSGFVLLSTDTTLQLQSAALATSLLCLGCRNYCSATSRTPRGPLRLCSVCRETTNIWECAVEVQDQTTLHTIDKWRSQSKLPSFHHLMIRTTSWKQMLPTFGSAVLISPRLTRRPMLLICPRPVTRKDGSLDFIQVFYIEAVYQLTL